MWPKILLGAFVLPTSPSPAVVIVASRYEQWAVVNLLLPVVSGLGRRPFPNKVQGLRHRYGVCACGTTSKQWNT